MNYKLTIADLTQVQLQAAIYLLKYEGQRGTEKQILKLINCVGPQAPFIMARDRGFVFTGFGQDGK